MIFKKKLYNEKLPEVMKRMCWAEVSFLVHLPWRVTRTNMRRWEWKGDQQRKKENTTTTVISLCQ